MPRSGTGTGTGTGTGENALPPTEVQVEAGFPVPGFLGRGSTWSRSFLLRGLAAATAELTFIALTHNLLKLFRGGAARMSLA